MGKILVVGSSNTDLIAKVKAFPGAGETIIGRSFLQSMGGKGANQAVAAHKLGGDVKFVTCLGKDPNGLNTMKYLSETGLDVSSSLLVEGVPSGTAIILVDDNGENCIVITPGANNMLSPAYIREVKHDVDACDMVVMQMEIPVETVRTVCEMAVRQNKKVMLNVAPACRLDSGLMQLVDILVVNETEAEVISGEKIDEIGDAEMINRLLDMGAGSVVLTLGRKGCLMKNHHESHAVPAYRVKAVDSTGAGDTFCGALAAELCRGNQWEDALRFATAASAICVTRMGAQPSIPTEHEVLEFLKSNLEPAHR